MKIKYTILKYLVFAFVLMLHILYIASCKKPGKDVMPVSTEAKAMAALANPGSQNNLCVFTLAGNSATTIFNSPGGVVVDANGIIYVADAGHNQIQKIDLNGNVSVLAGSGVADSTNGTGTAAAFNAPSGIALDKMGNLIVADKGNHLIRRITPQGVVTTIAGKGVPGHDDQPGTAATFNFPSGVAVDTSGSIYVADAGNNRIRLIAPDGRVFPFAGTGNPGVGDGGATLVAQFKNPVGIAVNVSGVVYVADKGNNAIRKIASGQVTTLAGSTLGAAGYVDAPDTMARFNSPSGVALGTDGNLYVADQANNRIRMIKPDRMVTTFAGDGNRALTDGTSETASFNFPVNVVTDPSGNVFVADEGNNRIRKIGFTTLPVTGYLQTFFLKADKTLLACGKNSNGQLGDGNAGNNINTPVGIMNDVSAVAVGESHSLFLKTDNTLWAVGLNSSGQLGDGSNTERHMPVAVMSNVKAIAAGMNHTLIQKTDNTLWVTGKNSFGQLGDSTTNPRNIPWKIMDDIKAITAGANFSLVIKTDNTLWVTGDNAHGQLGDGTINPVNRYKKVMNNVKAVAAGLGHTLILKTDNTLWATGFNGSGQLGNGTLDQKLIPIKVMDNVHAIAAGSNNSFFIKTDNTLWVSGDNSNHNLGIGDPFPVLMPTAPLMDHVITISAGNSQTFVLKADNTIWVAGQNTNGQLGDPNISGNQRWGKLNLP